MLDRIIIMLSALLYPKIKVISFAFAPVVLFCNIALYLGLAYEKYDAVSCLNKSNNITILINKKHKDAPKQALECLIEHEKVHNDSHNSIQEEIYAHTIEAKCWQKVDPAIKQINHPLVKRENNNLDCYRNNELESYIRNCKAYRNLPEK